MSAAPCSPFVKWVGGKQAAAAKLKKLLPDRIRTYREPFVGGGAQFFAARDRIASAHLNDAVDDLMAAYRAVQSDPERLIEALQRHAERNADEPYYYAGRDAGAPADTIAAASRALYLNATGYNGLYRVNRQGGFNVARGQTRRRPISDPTLIRAASIALENTRLTCGDFGLVKGADGDLIYCDPPEDEGFDRYTATRFGPKEQARLRNQTIAWHERGARVLITNSNTDLVRELYAKAPFRIRAMDQTQSVSPNARGKRTARKQMLVITTWETGT